MQGTRAHPYGVTVKIKPLNKETWNRIKKECEGKIESLQELTEGRFPKGLMEIFSAKGKGLFPSPEEIDFECSCPDWASMCKHVAATLYGVGTKLDDDPKLFFVLRKAEMDDLVTGALRNTSRKMLKKAEKKTSRVIDALDAGKIFGIDIDEKATPVRKPSPAKKQKKLRQKRKHS